MNCFPLEIVSKAKITQHFKKRVVVRSTPNVLDITSSKALLSGCRTGKIKLDFSQKMIFKLVHSRGRKKNRFIPLRNHHIAWANRMAFGLKKFEIFGS